MLKKEYISTVALFIAIVALGVAFNIDKNQIAFSGSTDDYFDAKGGFKVNGTTVIDSSGNVDGAVTSGSASTFASTVAITATTTISDGLSLRNTTGLCVDFYATSSATIVHLTASTTPTLPEGAAGIITFDYGPCSI